MARPLLSKAALQVVINPFAAPLDEHGRPCTIAQFDPDHGTPGRVRLIGCSLERSAKPDVRPRHRGVSASPTQYKRFETRVLYNLSPQPVPHSVYHVGLIKDGTLIAADEATASRSGVEYAEPGAVLLKAMSDAMAAWMFDHPDEAIDTEAWAQEQLFHWPSEVGVGPERRPAEDLPEDERQAAEARRRAAAKKALVDALRAPADAARKAAGEMAAKRDARMKAGSWNTKTAAHPTAVRGDA